MKETKTNKNIEHKQITQSIFYKMSASLIDEDAATAILKYPKQVGDQWQCDKYYCMICFIELHLCVK
nr:unnamed protein product [Callosobruchus chinensis]